MSKQRHAESNSMPTCCVESSSVETHRAHTAADSKPICCHWCCTVLSQLFHYTCGWLTCSGPAQHGVGNQEAVMLCALHLTCVHFCPSDPSQRPCSDASVRRNIASKKVSEVLQGLSPPQAADLQHLQLKAADQAGLAGPPAQPSAGQEAAQQVTANLNLAGLRSARQEVVHQAMASPNLASPHLARQQVVQQITADQSLVGCHPAKVSKGHLARCLVPQVKCHLIQEVESQLVVAQAKRKV